MSAMAPFSSSSQPFKTPKGYSKFSTFNPQQAQAFQGLLGQLGPGGASGASYLQSLLQGGQQGLDSFSAPYLRQFNEQTVPGLAERFSAMGSGAQQSSAFGQALSSAGAGLQENLAQLHSGLQMSAADRLLSNLQSLLGMNTMGFAKKSMPFWQQLLTAGAEGLGKAAGTAAFL